VPFTLGRLEIGELVVARVCIRQNKRRGTAAGITLRTFQIDLLDDSGLVIVHMEALSLKKLDPPPRADVDRERVMCFQPEWVRHDRTRARWGRAVFWFWIRTPALRGTPGEV
jgi:hypothetical protein